jgi:hypothetical protein
MCQKIKETNLIVLLECALGKDWRFMENYIRRLVSLSKHSNFRL